MAPPSVKINPSIPWRVWTGELTLLVKLLNKIIQFYGVNHPWIPMNPFWWFHTCSPCLTIMAWWSNLEMNLSLSLKNPPHVNDGNVGGLNLTPHLVNPLGWNHSQRNQGCQSKSFFQGLHMTPIIVMLVYNLKFCISNTPFNVTF